MRIADFILSQITPILEEWERFARTLAPSSSNMTSRDLRDHAEIMLKGIAADLRTEQSGAEEILKSHGEEPRTRQTKAGEDHGIDRRDFDFTIEQLVAEYRALRSSVLRLWLSTTAVPNSAEVDDIVRFNEAIDQLLAASVLSYATATRVAINADRERKDHFLAMLAHELRNPLAPITAAAALLSMTKSDDPTVVDPSNIISRQARLMATIMDDLLDVSRVTRGSILLAREALDLRHVIADAVEQALPKIHEKRQLLDITKLPDPIMLRGDRKRLVQVVANLLTNAAKYTPTGGHVRLTIDARGQEACITVEDDGIGLAPDFLPHVFDLFAQASQTSDRSSGGLGMGLALVKSLVELHKGSVTGHSDGIGRGSKFVVCLPRPRAVVAQADRRRLKRTPPPEASTSLEILIVDDNVDAATTLSTILEIAGHRTTLAHTGADALRYVASNVPDLFLLDIGLPDISGNELARLLRADSRAKSSVLVALTGYGQSEHREMTAASGFDHHLVKPVDMETLYKLVASVRPLAT